MQTKVQKWGNSLALRIPAAFAKELGMETDTAVDMMLEDDRIVITPTREGTFRLEDLLKKITRRNLHEEIDTGKPRGREIW